MRFARAMRDRLVSLVGPEPLHARRRRINRLQGGGAPFFSRFQWALPAKMERVGETDNQRARLGEAVPNAPAVSVTDAEGNPVKGALVSFAGDGTIVGPASPAAFSDKDGIASLLSWTLTSLGQSQLTASGFGIADPDDEARNGPLVGFDPFTPIPGDPPAGSNPDGGDAVDLETGMLVFTAEIHSILIYGPSMLAPTTFRPENEQTMAEAEGFTVTVLNATPWGNTTTAEFASYSAIVFGDRGGGAVLGAAEANKAVWSAAIAGPVIISALNPQIHQCDLAQPNCLTEFPQPGGTIVNQPEAVTLIKNAINFAASGAGTGAYISLDGHFAGAPENTPLTFLSEIGAFQVVGLAGLTDIIDVVAPTHSAMDNLTNAGLSGWFASAHQFIQAFPASYTVLAESDRNVGTVEVPDLQTLAVIIACSPVVEVTVCVVPSGGGGEPSPDASFDVAGGQSSSLSKIKVPDNIR